jgi:hypothetical protein|tara:strand:- start:29 stop:652 length:624 start_codon:yes stop_codon:yes gene_type:complete
MALNTLPAGAFADDAITSDKINLANTFAFTGTVTGTPQTLVKTGSLQSTTDAGDYSIDSVFSATYMNYFVTFKVAIAGANNQCHIKFRTGGATNSTSKYMSYVRWGDNTDGLGRLYNSYNSYAYLGSSLEETDSKAVQGFMYVFSPFSTTYLTNITAHFNSITDDGYRRMHFGGIQYDDTTSFDGFQFTTNTGNLSTVDIQVYGIKE